MQTAVKQKKNIRHFLILSLMIIILFLCGCNMQVNKTNYNKIENGMSFNEVVEILGDDYEVSSDASFGGYSSSCYVWKNNSGGCITIIFLDGNVYSKAQSGLK